MRKVHVNTVRVLRVLATTSILALSLAACGGSNGSVSGDGELVKLKAGTLPIDTCSVLMTAQAEGFFKKEGLDLEIESISSGSAINSAVVGGSLDLGCSSPGTVANAYATGLPVTVVSQGCIFSADEPTTELMIATDSTTGSAADLNGKRIAVNGLKNITQAATSKWLDSNGGDSTSIQWVELPFPQMTSALDENRVDAAVIAEPVLSAATADGEAKSLAVAHSAVGDGFSMGVFFASSKWADKDPELAQKFHRAISAAAEFSNENQDDTAKVLSDFAKVPLENITQMRRAVWETKLDPASIQPAIDVEYEYGNISKPVKAEDLISDSVLNQ